MYSNTVNQENLLIRIHNSNYGGSSLVDYTSLSSTRTGVLNISTAILYYNPKHNILLP